ncbi:MAG: patatin-like phospholipase family protein [Clostridiaceae bacterium]
MKKVLSIDGGGIRGIIPALILAEVEKRTGKRISELFDLIAGTSTGGILALGLVKPDKDCTSKPKFTADELAKLYEKEGAVIFYSDVWHKIISANGFVEERYPSKGIESVLEKYFGNSMLSDALTDVIITSYEIEKRTSWFFKSTRAKNPEAEGENLYMKDVARATSAAPTYFEPAEIQVGKGHAFIDGGVYANNPAMCAYAEAKTMFPNETDFLVVSLGTGEHTQPIFYKEAKNWGMVKWALPILNVVFDGVCNVIDYQLKQLLPPRNGMRRYYRFQAKLDIPSDRMDDATKDNIQELELLAWHIIKDNAGMIASLCSQLK